MKKEILINSSTAETRIALLEDGQLAEIFVERPENERNVGDIYKGRVRKVLVGMSAAFIDIGWQQDGFLHFNDASNLYDQDDSENGRKRDPASINLDPGQEVYVQIIKEPISGKGPRVTSEIALPGRFVVLIPESTHVGVSRKIADNREKRRLRTIAKRIKPADCGLIIRTVALERDEETLEHDVRNLVTLWRKIQRKGEPMRAPSLVYKEVSLASSVIRDLFTPDIAGVIVDSKSLHREIQRYLDTVSPSLSDRVEHYTDKIPLFDQFDIETEIEKGIKRKVWLEGGGHVIIEHTEAMVTIDVNSGKFIGKQNHEENSLKINLRAAREICRQLRLRDIGGIIAIDFIDMWEEKNRKKVYDEMKKEMRKDRAKADVTPIGAFGIMIMTRQRIKPSLLFTFKESCPVCSGTGMIASRETVVTEFERFIARFRYKSNERRLKVFLHPDLHRFLTENGPMNRINRIMLQHKIFIQLRPDSTISPTEFVAYSPRQKRDVTEEYKHA
ncbi:Rne/Rng family ribonuclease [bacterium]|nr:Rne/Rng family ribonuclease [bacterium]